MLHECALPRPDHFQATHARLCSHARSTRYVQPAFPRIVDDMDTVVDLCRNVPRIMAAMPTVVVMKTSNFGPLKCYGHITADILARQGYSLPGAMTAAPAECTRSLSFSTRSSVKIQLCARGERYFSGKVREQYAAQKLMSHDELAMLCNRATSLGPRPLYGIPSCSSTPAAHRPLPHSEG